MESILRISSQSILRIKSSLVIEDLGKLWL